MGADSNPGDDIVLAQVPPVSPIPSTPRVREVRAVRDYPDAPRKGASKPLYMRCDDDADYVVKFPVPAWPRALPNELIGAGLASLMKVLIPEPAIVTIPPNSLPFQEGFSAGALGPEDILEVAGSRTR